MTTSASRAPPRASGSVGAASGSSSGRRPATPTWCHDRAGGGRAPATRPNVRDELSLFSSGAAAIEPEPGETLGRKYRVVRQLGRGGMGVVLEAENVVTGARVALKLLQKALASDPEMLSRFLREARATALLRSRFVVTVFDVDQDDEGAPYIVMELLEGRDLAGEIRDRGAVPIDEVPGWIIQAAAARVASASTAARRRPSPG